MNDPKIAGPASAALGAPLRLAERQRLLAYASLLLLISAFAAPTGNLIGIPVIFFLKNKLHLSAPALARFNLAAGVPLYLGFVFGLIRDRWSPLGRGDRGHLLIFGLSAAALYLVMGAAPPSLGVFLVGLVVVTCATLIVGAAVAAIFSGMGREHRMAGQASAVLNAVGQLPIIAGSLLGGMFSELLEGRRAAGAARLLFGAGAALMVVTAALGLFAPRALLPSREDRPRRSFLADLARLARTGAVWPPLILLLLWNFAPGLGTALQYHLADQLHASDSQVGAFYAIFWASYLPTFALYGWACQKVRLSPLLLWGTLPAIPQMIPLLFVHSPAGALAAAVPMGLMGGFATAAYIDLTIRSAPEGLQGTMMMLVSSTAYFVALRFGDLWGAAIYAARGGWEAVVWITTAVYALMLLVIFFAPRRLTSTRDGEPISLRPGEGQASAGSPSTNSL
jgi:predicted MFS family arabinose efflux permease